MRMHVIEHPATIETNIAKETPQAGHTSAGGSGEELSDSMNKIKRAAKPLSKTGVRTRF